MTRAVLVGGPFDGAEGQLQYVPDTIGVFTCDGRCGDSCDWPDGLHWRDWTGDPLASRYVLAEIADSYAQYVYGPICDADDARFAAIMAAIPVCA